MNIGKAISAVMTYIHENNLHEAGNICRKILRNKPNNFDALYLLGVISYELKDFDRAMQNFRKALKVNPANAAAYYNLGLSLQEKKQFDEAIQCYQRSLQLDPALAEAYYNLGIAFQEQGRLDEALPCYQRVIQLKPDYADAHYNMGTVLREQGRQDEALSAYDRALYWSPDYISVRWARCMSQLPIIYPDTASIEVSRERYAQELRQLRDTITLRNAQEIENAVRAVGSQQPFLLACQGQNDRELQQLYGELVCKIMGSKYPQWAERPGMPALSSGEPIRVGIVSGYFCYHSIWKIPLRGWVENLDKNKFTLYGYYTGRIKDSVTETARQCCTRFVEYNYSFDELCNAIRGDNLHILIYTEIGMDPVTLRLAALRLAPVQCTALGHPETSGLPTIDYYLSSDLMEPPDAEEHYSEHLIRLPNLSFSYTPVDIQPLPLSRETFGLRPQSVLYLCSHSLFTHLPQYDELYPQIAREAGDCRFLFIEHRSGHITQQFHSRLKNVFQRFGMNADDYVVFLQRLNAARYIAVNLLSDVFLDTPGWSANNSTLEAVSCNLPAVTLPGPFMRQRHCYGILKMMGIMDTIVNATDEYIALAVRLGKDAEFRRHISEKTLANKHRLYHDRTCISALEDFIESVVTRKS
ncbi:MAG: tetratricopeptide repeat protein [Nitrospirota bacterium]